MNSKLKLICCATLAGCTASAAAAADYSIGIVGEVPLVCRATVDASLATPADGVAGLGQLREFCNSANGYRVFVRHSAELAGATLFVDGRAVPLSAEGSTLISESATAARASRTLVLEAPFGAQNGSLVFTITPR